MDISPKCIEHLESGGNGSNSLTRPLKESVVELKQVNRDCNPRSIGRSGEETMGNKSSHDVLALA